MKKPGDPIAFYGVEIKILSEIIMLLFMLIMYKNERKNIAIILGSSILESA